MVDSLARALKVKSSQVKSADRCILRTDSIIQKDINLFRREDSFLITKKDAYLDLKLLAIDSTVAYIRLSNRDTITRTEMRRSTFFSTAYTDIYLSSASPYNHITSGASFRVQVPRLIITIGPQIGYDLINRKATVGIGV
ncbi:hypothetical protein PV783_28260 [Chitinophaga sp. CC14]|uniref:hypothetical protein n=1 Tax=Chitinophaga sp. CC14 TaxID=3029199 RepID=UPI003B822932